MWWVMRVDTKPTAISTSCAVLLKWRNAVTQERRERMPVTSPESLSQREERERRGEKRRKERERERMRKKSDTKNRVETTNPQPQTATTQTTKRVCVDGWRVVGEGKFPPLPLSPSLSPCRLISVSVCLFDCLYSYDTTGADKMLFFTSTLSASVMDELAEMTTRDST